MPCVKGLPSNPGQADAHGTPRCAPAPPNGRQPDHRDNGECRENQKTKLIRSRELLGIAKTGREIESADPAGHPDESGHDTDLITKALRHELENSAVSHAKRQHTRDKKKQRHPGLRQMKARESKRDCRNEIHDGQGAYSADAIRQRTSNWSNK